MEKTNANPIDSSVFNVTLRDESVSKWFDYTAVEFFLLLTVIRKLVFYIILFLPIQLRFLKLGAMGGAVTCELYLKSCNSEDFPRDGILIAFEVNFSCEGSTDYFYGKKSEGTYAQ